MYIFKANNVEQLRGEIVRFLHHEASMLESHAASQRITEQKKTSVRCAQLLATAHSIASATLHQDEAA